LQRCGKMLHAGEVRYIEGFRDARKKSADFTAGALRSNIRLNDDERKLLLRYAYAVACAVD
jgi:hypothetical protein